MARKKRGFLKRWILCFTGLVIVTLLSLFLVGVIWIGPLVKKAVETHGPEALGAQVQVEEVDIGVLRGVVKVRGLVVGNPQGYAEPTSIEVGNFQLNMKLSSLFTDTIVITDILVEQPVVTYEKQTDASNLLQLQRNAAEWAESLSAKEKKEQKRPKKVIIERLRIVEGTVRVKLPHLPAVPIQLPYIERSDIGEDKPDGQNFGLATKEILASLNLNVSSAVEHSGEVIETAAKEAKAALEVGKEVGGDVLKAGEKALDDAGERLKGLFGQ